MKNGQIDVSRVFIFYKKRDRPLLKFMGSRETLIWVPSKIDVHPEYTRLEFGALTFSGLYKSNKFSNVSIYGTGARKLPEVGDFTKNVYFCVICPQTAI